MVFWIAACLIAAAVALPLLSALRGAQGRVVSGAASDISVYRDQLTEVDRDLARGVLTEAEAEAVRTEVSRRLLEADSRAAAEGSETAGQLLPAAAMVAAMLAGSAWLYTSYGAPGYPDLPMKDRIAELDAAAASRIGQVEAETLAAANMPNLPPADPRFQELMTQLRNTVEQRPDDLRGLALLAENEAKIGNFVAAREAQMRVLQLKGDTANEADLLMGIDIMVFGAGGYISPEAELLIRRLLAVSPESGAGRYYAGLTLAQNGRPDQAFPIWRRLLETSPPQAPWVPVIQAEIAGVAEAAGVNYAPTQLPGPDAEAMAAADAMSDEDRQAMIEGMVEGLAERLATEGGPPEEWARLITALGVLGDTDRAGAILNEAHTAFSNDEDALAMINAAAQRAGLGE
ncbi:c-type cytochrome biogenesis protein CcmI [bacterium]|nr:c-type cytochrome biogenesis protein CcmI [bacterium]